MRIHCTPGATGPEAWTHAYQALKELWLQSSPRLHTWEDSPADADIILLCNPFQPQGDVSAAHPLRRRYPEKTFVLHDNWVGPFRFPGIYANAPKAPFWRGRFRTASYALHHPDFKNPYIQRHEPADALPPESRDVLFSFAGRDCHPCRARLFSMAFKRPDIVVKDTSAFDAFRHGVDGKEQAQRDYYELSLRSRFILCPRGVGPNSVRLFEALQLGIAPIIVSDAWIPCDGPDWKSFALFVPERNVHRIEEIATAHEPEFVARGEAAFRAHQRFFAPSSYFNYLVSAATSIQHSRLVPERLMQASLPVVGAVRQRVNQVTRRLAPAGA